MPILVTIRSFTHLVDYACTMVMGHQCVHNDHWEKTVLKRLTAVTHYTVVLATILLVGCDDANETATGDESNNNGLAGKGDYISSSDVVFSAAMEPSDDKLCHDTFLWRGLDHEWLRSVAGFRVPHRISQLDSFITAQACNSRRGYGEFHMGQSTGVDGNFMTPSGYYTYVADSALYSHSGSVTATWTDDSDDSEFPQAISEFSTNLSINLDSFELGYGAGDHYGAVLAGFELETTCNDALQPADRPCNSDGMWPHRFYFELDQCERDGDKLFCPLSVSIHRSWTPNLGGIPPFETKPFTDKLTFRLTVHFNVIGGAHDAVNLAYGPQVEMQTTGRDYEGVSDTQPMTTRPDFANTQVGLVGFGFELSQPEDETADKFNHLGRYIGAISTQVQDVGYDFTSGGFVYRHSGRIWLPDTVKNANVHLLHRAVALQTNSVDSAIHHGEAKGQLCRNSSPQAPALTAWDKCDSGDRGPEQTRDIAPLSLAR